MGRLKDIVGVETEVSIPSFVDDAHGFGTMGKQVPVPVKNKVYRIRLIFYFGTFAKGMA